MRVGAWTRRVGLRGGYVQAGQGGIVDGEGIHQIVLSEGGLLLGGIRRGKHSGQRGRKTLAVIGGVLVLVEVVLLRGVV